MTFAVYICIRFRVLVQGGGWVASVPRGQAKGNSTTRPLWGTVLASSLGLKGLIYPSGLDVAKYILFIVRLVERAGTKEFGGKAL